MRSVCVFCGSSSGARPEYREQAEALGRELAGRGLRLVYGGAHVGLMGAVADATLAAGGEVVGVIPQGLVRHEIQHTGLTELLIVASMHERKAEMAARSDAFIALPGGVGTLEELCEALTWTQLGIHHKPCGILNVLGFFDPLLALLDRAADEEFLRAEHRALLHVGASPPELLDRLRDFAPSPTRKWL
jgi:uncharacterized protein (TIGR00730 family)